MYLEFAMENKRECLDCGKPIEGRIDKKYCNQYCRSSYQYKNKKAQTNPFYTRVDNQLKRNRKILAKYNKAGKATVRKEVLIKDGFDSNFFTHYWKNKKGQVYLFCYEFGFLATHERGNEKYLLVHWQDYMEK